MIVVFVSGDFCVILYLGCVSCLLIFNEIYELSCLVLSFSLIFLKEVFCEECLGDDED